MYVPEQKETEINGKRYSIKALPADYGLSVLNTLQAMQGNPPADFIEDLVLRSVTVNSIQPTKEWFSKNFARNYKELYDLFHEIVEYNFGNMEDEESPNEQSGEDTSEVRKNPRKKQA